MPLKDKVATVVKWAIWCTLRPFHRGDAWPITVLAGPAKSTKLMLDLRKNGSYFLGTYDAWILNRIRIENWLPRGGVAWDCGAYVGFYTALMRNAVGEEGAVIAFEASAQNYAALSKIPALNNWSNVEIIHSAVGPDHCIIEFAGGFGGASGPTAFKSFDDGVDREAVPSVGIDELVFERGVASPDFVKFDLEGAEIAALRNGDRLFSQRRPVLLLEVHGEAALDACGHFLEQYSYMAWDIRYFNQLGAAPFVNSATINSCKGGICNTLFCIPIERADFRRKILAES